MRKLVAEAGSVAEVARRSGKQDSQLNAVLNGVKSENGTPRGIGHKMAADLEKGMRKPEGWMDSAHTGLKEPAAEYSVKQDDDAVKIPHLTAVASMGSGLPDDLGHDTVVDTVSLSKEWIRSNLTSITSPANLKMLTGYGDSMQGTFSHGDVLFVDTGVSDVKVDAVYVLRLNDELYIKRLQRLPNGDIKMISDNRSYDPYVIENGEKNRFDVLGRVAGVWNFKRL